MPKASAAAQAIESQTQAFYDSDGWVPDSTGRIGEDRRFRPDESARGAYADKVAGKPAGLLQGRAGSVLFAGPGDLPDNHLRVARRFERAVCVDISEKSLELCRARLGEKGDLRQGSLLDLPLADDSVDAALCAHVLYHVDAASQARCVEELIRVTRPGGRIVILYANPSAPGLRLQRGLKALGVNRLLGANDLYFFNHPRDWWRRFEDRAAVSLVSLDALSARQERALLPLKTLRRAFSRWADRFEDARPETALKLWTYVAVALDPKPGQP